MKTLFFLVLLALLPSICLEAKSKKKHKLQKITNQGAFTHIYNNAGWGKNSLGEAHSGPGSTVESSQEYIAFLQKFIREHTIRTIVDVGCGDWEVMKHINLTGIRYIGIDVVQSVIEKNQQKYATPTIAFIHADATTFDLPVADLFLSKDVLQHIPNEDILLITAQFPKFRHCLVTNDINLKRPAKNNKPLLNRGGWHPLDLTQPPFNLTGTAVLTYKLKNTPYPKRMFHIMH